MLYLNKVSSYVPDSCKSLQDLVAENIITSAEAAIYARIYGLNRIPIAKDEDIVGLMTKSITKVLSDSDQKNVKFLIHTHTARVLICFNESAAYLAARKLKLNNAQVFGVTLNNCASTLVTLILAENLLKNYDKKSQAIIITADKTFTPILKHIPGTSVTAEASAAIMVGRSGTNNKLIAVKQNIYGAYSAGVWQSVTNDLMFEALYAKLVADTIHVLLADTGLTLNQIKLILPHNINLVSWKKVAKLLKISLEKIYLQNIKTTAHCFGADNFINYLSAKEEGLLLPGDLYLMVAVGLGATFAVALFQH